MIEEVRRVKLEELNKQAGLYEEEKNTIENNYGLEEIRNKLDGLKADLFVLDWDFAVGTPEYELRAAELSRLISETEKELNEAATRANQETGIGEITKKLEEIKRQIAAITQAQTLYEIGITPVEAVELLESNGIEPVLSEADKVVFQHPRDYSSKSSLIAVHKTRFAPTENRIKTSKEADAQEKSAVHINGTWYEYSYDREMDTIHMAMNNEVSSHDMGNWDDCKYSILIPFEDIPNEKVGAAAPMDTFTKGGIELPEGAWILCPKDEAEKVKQFNPQVHVLGYEGENALGFSGPFLTQLGYRAESMDKWNWNDKESASEYDELIAKEGLLNVPHTATSFCQDMTILQKINAGVAESTVIKDNRLITALEEIKGIMDQLPSAYFGTLFDTLSSIAEHSERTNEERVTSNCEKLDVFFEKMQDNGLDIPTSYQEVMRMVCRQTRDNFDKSDLDMVLTDSSEIPEDEKKTIRDFQTDLANGKSDAFSRFCLTSIGETIFHSTQREILAEKQMEESVEMPKNPESVSGTPKNTMDVFKESAEAAKALPQQEAMQAIVAEMEREANRENSMIH